MHDSTESVNEAIVNNTMAHPATGSRAMAAPQFSNCPRLAGRPSELGAPRPAASRTSALVEVDFFACSTPDGNDRGRDVPDGGNRFACCASTSSSGQPVLDVLASEAARPICSAGAAPTATSAVAVRMTCAARSTTATHQLRHRSKLFIWLDEVTVEALAPIIGRAQRDGEIPDGQGGLRIFVQRWLAHERCARARSLPTAAARRSLGISGDLPPLHRCPRVPRRGPRNRTRPTNWGASAEPVPAHRGGRRAPTNLGNALSATAKAPIGTSIAKLALHRPHGRRRIPQVLWKSLDDVARADVRPGHRPEGLVTYDAATRAPDRRTGAPSSSACSTRAPFGMDVARHRGQGMPAQVDEREDAHAHTELPFLVGFLKAPMPQTAA